MRFPRDFSSYAFAACFKAWRITGFSDWSTHLALSQKATLFRLNYGSGSGCRQRERNQARELDNGTPRTYDLKKE